MTDTRIDAPRNGEPRAAKLAQYMSSVRSAGAAGEEAQGFSVLLAALDDLAGLAAAGLAEDSAMAEDAPEEKPALSTLAQEDALLAAQGHAPWMSLVGQTARLDAQGNVDLSLVKQATRLNSQSDVDLSLVGQTARLDAKGDASQSVTTDFLSGRGNITQLAHRQELQQGLPSAHAALQTQDIQKNPDQTQTGQAQAAIDIEAATSFQSAVDNPQLLETEQGAQVVKAEDALTARSEPVLHGKAQGVETRGISLQGMTAVQPQVLEGLKDLLRTARSPQPSETEMVGKSGPGAGSHEAVAAAVGLAMGASSGNMQGGGQDAANAEAGMDGQPGTPTEREQEVSEQVAFWVHQKTQNAALSIQHEGKPIQVQVQLHGQEAHVRFAADDEQARQLLADGQSQLGELLQAQGLNLAGVSVDAGGAGAEDAGRRGADAQPAQTRLARVSSRAAELPADAALAQRNTVPDGRPGVDLFV